ncbi:LysR family transcriptional regulator [Rhodococcus globerulus]|uniref:LysR family transcriptional regulator n=1 Tax=Rhodococcus globerulus TaxID=33008 RepID=A0ABU4C3U6_RHOGO|nr:LysR family transcriptional regulator [Rhodococcus globerulus]MDV6271183.1 LysR family transcriptional regulator [Rhodococcus globerulus]
MFELVWLRTWVEVVDAGGFSKAAEAIHLSQPRVSAHIANLERSLGCILIERRIRPLALTEEGRALLPKARAVLSAAEDLADVRHARETLTGSLRIASFASASAVFLPGILVSLRDKYPGLDVSVFDGDVQSIESALGDRRVSVALRPLRPEPADRTFTFRPLWREPFVVLLPTGHDLCKHDSIALAQLADAHVITIGNPLLDSYLGYEAEAALHAAFVEIPVGTVSHQPTTLASTVRAGLGVGVVNRLAVDMIRMDGLEVRPITDLHRFRDVGVWWHTERPLSRASRAFIEAVLDAPIPVGGAPVPTFA